MAAHCTGMTPAETKETMLDHVALLVPPTTSKNVRETVCTGMTPAETKETMLDHVVVLVPPTTSKNVRETVFIGMTPAVTSKTYFSTVQTDAQGVRAQIVIPVIPTQQQPSPQPKQSGI
jgi:hypothetical protein